MTTRYVKGLKAEHPSKRLGVAGSGRSTLEQATGISGLSLGGMRTVTGGRHKTTGQKTVHAAMPGVHRAVVRWRACSAVLNNDKAGGSIRRFG